MFVEALVRHHQPGDDTDLAEARQLVEKLRSIRVNPMALVILEAQIDKAANQLAAANARIREFAGQPGLTAKGLTNLAVAGRAARPDSARPRPSTGPSPPGRPPTRTSSSSSMFLARRRRIKEAIDLCETLRADPALRDPVAAVVRQDRRPTPVPPSTRSRPNASLAWLERGP